MIKNNIFINNFNNKMVKITKMKIFYKNIVLTLLIWLMK